MRDLSRQTTLMNGQAATGPGSVIDVSMYRHVELTFSSSGTAAFTIQVQISQSQTEPDFSSAASATNKWTYVQLKDLMNAATYNGNVGVVFATDEVVNVEVNTNLIKWLCPNVTAYTQGNVFCDVSCANDSLQ